MSEENEICTNVNTTDWWYYVAALMARYFFDDYTLIGADFSDSTKIVVDVKQLDRSQPKGQFRPIGEMTLSIHERHIRMCAIPASPEDERWWTEEIKFLNAMGGHAFLFRRRAAGARYKDLLDEYYIRIENGERLKLKAFAEAEGVDYDSLRQAKFRYDEKQRKKKM